MSVAAGTGFVNLVARAVVKAKTHIAARIGLMLFVWGVSQLALWGGVTWAEYLSRPAGMSDLPQVTYNLRRVDGTLTAPALAQRDGTDGYVVSRDTGGEPDSVKSILFTLPFTVVDPEEPLALYLSIREQISEIRVNGDLVQPQLALNKVQGIANTEPGLYLLPPRALKTGENRITIEQSDYGYAFSLPEFSIGPAETLGTAYRWKTFFMVDLAIGGIFVLIFTSLMVIMIDWPAGDRQRARRLIAFLTSSVLVTYLFSFNPPLDVPLNVMVSLLILAGLTNSLCALDYALSDIGLPRHWTPRLLKAGLALAGAVVIALITGLIKPELSASLIYLTFDVSHYVIATVCIIAALCLSWGIAWLSPSKWAERLVIMVCLMTFAVDHIGSLIDLNSPFIPSLPLTLYLSPVVGVLLGSALLISISQQAGEARRVVATANKTLAASLQAREAELREGHQRQQRLMQRQVRLEERERIVRDMHDGIGGQLLGLMLQVRGGRLENKAVEASLQIAIDDLRLIVDSLDSAEEGLCAALRAFEYRARPQIEAADLKFVASLTLSDDDGLRPGPRASLQVLRIAQEAVTNALRHAKARKLSLSACVTEGQFVLGIHDDGHGFANTAKGGRGLTNMKARARRLGGQLEVSSGETGTDVTFTVPVDVINRLGAEEVGL